MSEVVHHLRVLRRLALAGVAEESVFRTDFFVSTLQFFVYVSLFVAFWQGVVRPTGRLSHWRQHELVILSFVIALHSVLLVLFLGIRDLPERVRAGELDKYLCRPVHALFVLCFETIPVVEFSRSFAVNLIAIWLLLSHYGLARSAGSFFLSLLFLMVGTAIIVCMNGAIATTSFWLGRIGPLWTIVGWARSFDRYPVDIFPRPLLVLLSWVVPVGLIATYPTMILLAKPLPWVPMLCGAVALLAVWFALFWWTASKALARYEAFGG